MILDTNFIEHLQEYLIKKRTIDLNTGCWIPGKCKNKNKYVNINYHGVIKKAYVWSAIAFLGYDHENPNNRKNQIEICHSSHCYFQACFNPSHIYIGNHSTNKKDYWDYQKAVKALEAKIEELKRTEENHEKFLEFQKKVNSFLGK